MTDSYQDHVQWLEGLRRDYDTLLASTAARALAGAAPPALQTQRSPPSAAAAPLPSPPMAWAMPEEANEDPSSMFAGPSFDSDDFDAPVYRSLDVVFTSTGSSPTGGPVEDDFEFTPPTYRGGLSFDGNTADENGESVSVEEAQRRWLATMPPMLHRQNARGSSLVMDLAGL